MTTDLSGASPPRVSLPDRILLAGLFLALAVCPIVFVPQLYDDFTLIKQSVLLLAAGTVLIGLALQGFPICAPRPVRLALGAWVAMVVISEALAMDPRGSALGVYQYRQGFLTQLAYVALLVGAMRASVAGLRNWVVACLCVGLTGVWLYTAIQALGLDPVDWWTDTSARAIGTIGNANELAAMAVAGMVAFGALTRLPGRKGIAASVALAAATGFVVLESESRSGIAALVVLVMIVPAGWWISGAKWRDLRKPMTLLLAGFVLSGLMSFAAGGLAGSASRIQSGAAGADRGGSTRIALWQGTVEVIKNRPVFGAGPDGLFLAFPIDRPADLGGAFETYDLVAQSSHNLALDTAANYGLPGLAALVALVALSARTAIVRVRRIRTERETTTEPWVWAAIAAYGAIILLNPISLAAHAVFFVSLGLLAGTDVPVPKRTVKLVPPMRVLAVAPAVLLALFVAIRLPMADYRANRAWEDYAAGDFDLASNHYADASERMPLERNYATQHARALVAAGVDGPAQRLAEANAAFIEMESDFGLVAGDYFAQATALIGLKRDAADILPLIDEGLRLNPHGLYAAEYAEILRKAAQSGGTLRYSEADRWVVVEVP